MKQIVLIGLNGREVARLPFPPKTDAWIFHDGKWYGFGVGKLDGEHHYYQADPEPQPMGPLTSEHPDLQPKKEQNQ